jgi:hypothetical protein
VVKKMDRWSSDTYGALLKKSSTSMPPTYLRYLTLLLQGISNSPSFTPWSFTRSAPDPHTLVLKELKILHVTTVNPSVACIVAPKLETLCLGIPTLQNADAGNVLNAIFDGSDHMIKPRHLTLTAPVHDKHLISALKHLPDLMSLQLDHQVPFSKTFF